MFLDKLFGNAFGVICLVVLMLAILVLLVWLFVKQDKVKIEEISDVRVEVEGKIDVINENKEETVTVLTSEKKETVIIESEYDILEGEDGFFRVKKKGTERTLRKFATEMEAKDFVEKRGLKNDWS